MKGGTWKTLAVLTLVLSAGLLAGWTLRHSIRALVWRLELPRTEPAGPGVLRFAVIGDYGMGTPYTGHVALMLESWHPEFIVTVGDNNYPEGSAATIDENVGRFFHSFIFPYLGKHGRGASTNRFFPIPGHVDWDTDELHPYLDYFSLPGNERYYDLVRGPVHLFLLDSDEREPDGARLGSVQAGWLEKELRRSDSSWNLVFAHHAPYTSHTVEDIGRMRWPFAEWGADGVLSGYYHVYERLEVDGIPYFVNGTGGAWVSHFGETDQRSQFRSNRDFGGMIVDADRDHLLFRYVNRWGRVIDQLAVTHAPEGTDGLAVQEPEGGSRR